MHLQTTVSKPNQSKKVPFPDWEPPYSTHPRGEEIREQEYLKYLCSSASR